MMRRLIFLFVLMFALKASAQITIGNPTIVNYTRQDYNAGTQNWNITQDPRGIMYFANNQGLLCFDGAYWRKYELPNHTVVRSVWVSADQRIYVGGQSEFGYFMAGANGDLQYHSLAGQLNEAARDFTDVWNICEFRGHVFFRAYRKIFEYDGRSVKVHDGIHWNFMGRAGPELFAYEYNKGLVKLEDGSWKPVLSGDTLDREINIRSAIALGSDSILLVTLTHGLKLLQHGKVRSFSSPFLDQVQSQILYGAIDIGRGQLALITNLSGCIIINHQGEFIQKLSRQEGIQNNNTLAVFMDRDRNLWLGLDNGIDLVLYSNAIRNIFPEAGNHNTGYASIKYGNKLYLGLSSGAFVVTLENERDLSYTRNRFSMVEGSKGQVWGFSQVGNTLLMGHNSGAYIIKDNKATVLDPKTGFWEFDPLNMRGYRDVMLAGTYNGINFYRFDGNTFVNPRIHAHFESARFIVQHGDEIWVAHPIKGLYRVAMGDNLSSRVSMYADHRHILSSNHNKLFSLMGQMVLVTDKGMYRYDDRQMDFVPFPELQQKLGQTTVNYLKEDQYGNIWFIRDKKLGVWDGHRLAYIPELNEHINSEGFEHINVLDSNNVLIASEQGFFHLDYAAYKNAHFSPKPFIRNVRTLDGSDSVLYGGFSDRPGFHTVPYRLNALHFEFSSDSYGQASTLEYSYYLEGFEKDWSAWTRKTEKDYTNIPPGKYSLHLRLRNKLNRVSPEQVLKFEVYPPWYRSWIAYAFYALLLFLILYWFYKRQQLKYAEQQQRRLKEQQEKYEEEQQRLRMSHQLELAENEKQIAELQSEKLLAEVTHKNSELATNSMNLVHKMELLSSLKADLVGLKEQIKGAGAREIQKIIKTIDGEIDHEQQWEEFARHFDSVHTDYLKKLKEFCPELSPSELKLSAYLRLNLSTKEIAQLMNISTRGVETSRYRLRKKLGLTKDDEGLNEFLIRVTNS